MNTAVIAAIIKRHGVRALGGRYELFLTDSQLASVVPGSLVQEARDDARGGLVLVLTERPRVIDVQPVQPSPPVPAPPPPAQPVPPSA
jgi:hypothetical protein